MNYMKLTLAIAGGYALGSLFWMALIAFVRTLVLG